MKNTDPRVDEYIENAPDFAKPILEKLRRAFHKAYPAIQENIKWSTPSFEYKGIVAGMGAFKTHVAYGFWKARAMSDPEGLFEGEPKSSPFRIRAESVKDLPAQKVLVAYTKEAVELNEKGVRASPMGDRRKKPKKPAPKAPSDFAAALKRNRGARTNYEKFAPSAQREYVEWIEEAKREATRGKRIATAVEWLAEGKPRNWKYMKKW